MVLWPWTANKSFIHPPDRSSQLSLPFWQASTNSGPDDSRSQGSSSFILRRSHNPVATLWRHGWKRRICNKQKGKTKWEKNPAQQQGDVSESSQVKNKYGVTGIARSGPYAVTVLCIQTNWLEDVTVPTNKRHTSFSQRGGVRDSQVSSNRCSFVENSKL